MSTGLPVQTEFSEQQRACSADMDRDASCQVLAWCSVEDFHWEAGFKQLFFQIWVKSAHVFLIHSAARGIYLSARMEWLWLAVLPWIITERAKQTKGKKIKRDKTGEITEEVDGKGQTEEEERRSVWTGYVRLWKRWCCEPFRRIVADKGI